ncbi:hypothetical protein ABPG75_012689 [Micractinium tetrahymenae]
MGVGWRRFTEKLHQGAPLHSSGGLQPTSNARCSTMLQEATAFTSQLRRCEKAIRSMAAANTEAGNAIKLVMSAPLPVRWEETAAGAGGATAAPQPIGGSSFSGEVIARSFADAGHRLESEVLSPLARWQEVFTQLGTRYRELEGVRLEVDSRRRTVADLSRRVDTMRARLGKGGDAKQEAALEETIKRLQHKEGKLQVATQSFMEQEALLHRDLSTLISDAAWLRHYVAAAFRLEGHALLTSAEAFGPLPGGASPPPASKLAVTVGAPPATPAMAGGPFEAAPPATAQHAARYERAEEPVAAAAAAGPGRRVVAAHRRGSSGSLYPVTPAAEAPAPPMARFPVTESGQGEGGGFTPHRTTEREQPAEQANMGAGWRRWKEKVRESMPGSNADLTSNARNRAMMKTATDFAAQVKKCEKAIRAAHSANAELLSTTKATMALPLPQTYEDSNAGAGGAAAVALHQVGGPHFKAESISRMGNESGHKLETEVLAPLTRWQDVHLQLAARFKELENTRLELDSRRRTVTEMSNKVSQMRAKLGASGGGVKTEAKLDSTIRTLSHKEAKLKVTTQNFDQQEALLARDLAALISDGQYLKHYVAAALRLQGGALLGAADAFGELSSVPAAPAPVPSPADTPTSSLATSGAGAAGFGGGAGVPAATGGAPAEASNPYHSTGSLPTGPAPTDQRAYQSAGPISMSVGSTTKRFSEPEAQPAVALGPPGKSVDGGPPAARFPVAEAATDNPYAVRGYSYA